MKMNARNIILIILAVLVGLYLGLKTPIGLILILPLMGYVAFVFMRNQSGAKADPAETAAAMRLEPAAGKARIYVMRKGFVGGQQGMNITVDGILNSQIRSGYFLMAEVDPGEHSITGHFSSQTKSSAVTETVSVVAGECHLLDAKFNMGALQGKIIFDQYNAKQEISEKLNGLKLIRWKESREPAQITG
jgi:hypothetical protein